MKAWKLNYPGCLRWMMRPCYRRNCVNGWYWATDVTLNTDVMVETKERLVRAAELVANGEYTSDLAAAVEAVLLDQPDPGTFDAGALPGKLLERFGKKELSSYLEAAQVEPSAYASRRFVVYAVSVTLAQQSVYLIDLEHVDRGPLGGSVRWVASVLRIMFWLRAGTAL
jgi:hypothetical protein